MGHVSVPINGRSFLIACEDGQEPRIRRLAQYVDAKVAGFVANAGQVGEARLLLLAALAIADELSDANDALQHERTRTKGGTADREAGAEAEAKGVHGPTPRLEAIAGAPDTP